jgi:hypothetical protein
MNFARFGTYCAFFRKTADREEKPFSPRQRERQRKTGGPWRH